MLTFQKISHIFLRFLDNTLIDTEKTDDLDRLIRSCIEINQKIWNLEDIARMRELGLETVALTQKEINKSNQTRNDLIQKIDLKIEKILKNDPTGPRERFYAESPGMIIDRLAILFIRLSIIKKITALLTDKDLEAEYFKKERAVSEYIHEVGTFLDLYLSKIQKGEVFFRAQGSIKIYNDERVRAYIKKLMEESGSGNISK